jgi:hypothetical protein
MALKCLSLLKNRGDAGTLHGGRQAKAHVSQDKTARLGALEPKFPEPIGPTPFTQWGMTFLDQREVEQRRWVRQCDSGLPRGSIDGAQTGKTRSRKSDACNDVARDSASVVHKIRTSSDGSPTASDSTGTKSISIS